MATEDCGLYQTGGQQYVPIADASDPPLKYLRGLAIETGKSPRSTRRQVARCGIRIPTK